MRKIDLEEHKLLLHHDTLVSDSFVNTDEPTQETNFCLIHAQHSFIAPPNSEVLVSGDLRLPYTDSDTGLVVPRAELTERYQIAGACELVKVFSTNSVPIRLLNPTTQPVRIYRKTRLGKCSLIPPLNCSRRSSRLKRKGRFPRLLIPTLRPLLILILRA